MGKSARTRAARSGVVEVEEEGVGVGVEVEGACFCFFFRRWKVRSSSFVIVEGELVSSFIYVDGVYAMSRIGLYASAGEERRGRGVGGSDHSMAEA
jgi:hypothetical protein